MLEQQAKFSLALKHISHSRIWASENPQVIEERLLHPEKVLVWCALWSEGVI